ncbi:UNVERIFIED_CONTAM: Transcription factor COE1 [Siphonaria sp. JEL0065]|nr:Transcription factor COE1 [Siphonaria sp. JEL0065]
MKSGQSFNTIPPEIQLRIFGILCSEGSLSSLKHLAMVCHDWKILAETAVLVPSIRHSACEQPNEVLLLAKQACGALRILDLGNTSLPIPPAALKHVATLCPNVTHLNLCQFSQLSSSQLVFILHRMPRLQHVNFTGLSAITDIHLQILARQSAKSLVTLLVSSCSRITDKGLGAILSKCPNLKTLKAANTQAFSDNILSLLTSLLEEIDICGSQDIGTRFLQQAFLGHLDPTLYTALVPPIIDYVKPQDYNLPTPPLQFTPALIHISSLNLSNCVAAVTDDLLTILGWSTPNLRIINLQDCARVTDVGISRLAEGCLLLSATNFSGCTLIGDVSLDALGMCCGRTLERVCLSKCPEITDEGVFDLVSQCTKLRLLILNDNPLLTDLLLQSLQKDPAPTLQTLELEHCPNISQRAVSTLLERVNSLPQFKRLRRLSIESFSSLLSFNSVGSGERIVPASRRSVELVVVSSNGSNNIFGIAGGPRSNHNTMFDLENEDYW